MFVFCSLAVVEPEIVGAPLQLLHRGKVLQALSAVVFDTRAFFRLQTDVVVGLALVL